jgi:general stress protein YciG
LFANSKLAIIYANKEVYMPRGNSNNLKKNLSPEEAREQGRKGGIASGKARRAKKNKQQIINMVLNAELKGESRKAVERLVGKLSDEDANIFTAMVMGQVKAAMNGSTKAFQELYDISEQDGSSTLNDVDEVLVSIAKTAHDA